MSLSLVSHELRTPTSIRGALGLLEGLPTHPTGKGQRMLKLQSGTDRLVSN